jgi:putative membrane protein
VIGWNLRSTWFQRRAGLTDLVATTAGGRQQVRVLDLDAATVVPLVAEATPGLLEPFLEG